MNGAKTRKVLICPQIIMLLCMGWVLVLTGFQHAYSQQPPATQNPGDELNKAIKNKAWSSAAKASLDLAIIEYQKFRYDKAIDLNLQGIQYAKKAGDIDSEAWNLFGIGVANFDKYNYALALEYCFKALKLSAKINDPELVMEINNKIGMVYKRLEDSEKARSYFLPAYQEALRLKKGPVADLLVNLGNVEMELGNYPASIDYYNTYLALRPNDAYTKVIGYNNLGKVYLLQHELEKASVYFHNAYEVEDTVRNPRGRAYSFQNFANIARAKGEYQQAIDLETKSLGLSSAYKIKSLMLGSYQLLADCYPRVGNYQQAYLYLGKLTVLKDSIFARRLLDRISVLDATYTFDLENEKKQAEIRLLNQDNALKKLQVSNLLDKDRINQLMLTNLQKEKSLSGLELNNLEQKDSLSQLKLENYNKANVVTNMQLQSLARQNELKNLELSLQHRNQLLWAIATGLLLVAFIYYYRRSRLKKLLELEKIRSNIAADFHDEMGSALSSIALYSDMAIRDHPPGTTEMKNILSHISESSRNTVSAMHDMIWSIQPKNDHLEEVIFRMREFAFPYAELKNTRLAFKVDESLMKLQTSMNVQKNIYLVFKEALNNAFKYSHAANINISLSKSNDQLILEINDDGLGFDVNQIKQGNGLRNMRKRAEQTKGNLFIKSKEGDGTLVSFKCPLRV